MTVARGLSVGWFALLAFLAVPAFAEEPRAAEAATAGDQVQKAFPGWTPDVASVDESIRLALADRDSQTAQVVVYRGRSWGGYFPYRAFYRPYLGVGYSYFPASYYVSPYYASPYWGYSYYAGYPYYPSYASYYAPYAYASYYPAYYAPPVVVAPLPGYCGCYYW